MPLYRTYTRKKHGITSWKFLWHSSLLHFFSSTLIGHNTVHHEYEHALHNPVSVLVSVLSFSVLFQFCFSPVQSCFSPVSVLFSPVSTLFQSCFRPVQSCFAVLFQPYFLLKFTNLESGSSRAPLGKLIMTSRGAIISARPSLLDVFRSSTIKIFFCKRKKKSYV